MAKANSHTLSNIRGSVGGLTYTANQFQTIVMRTRAAPTNPKTDFQTEVRSAFSGAETLWKGLSGSQRAQWNDYADTLTFTGPLGTYKLPGRQVFMGIFTCATYWKQRGGAIGALDPTPPVIPGFLDIDNVHTSSFTAPGATGVALQFEYSGAEDIETYCIRSIGYNGSRMRGPNSWLPGTAQFGPIVAPGSAEVNFQGLTADLAYFMQLRAITQEAPFRLSAQFQLRSIAVENP